MLMKPELREKWSRTRTRGKLDYVLKAGVMSYGLPMFLIMTFFFHRDRLAPLFIVLSALMWLLGGVLFGLVMWHVYEARYNADSAAERN